jgi:phosphohistidine phosphatase SixA
MIFILLRHGHKSMEPPENPTLSGKGHEQARQLLKMVQEKTLPAPTVCIYSDKIRTKETLSELIDFLKTKNELKTDLNMREYNETATQFRTRIQKLVNLYTYQGSQPENKNQVVYACTHYDWIEEAMTVIDSDKNLNSYEFASWSPAQYIEFKINEDGIWQFRSRGAAG